MPNPYAGYIAPQLIMEGMKNFGQGLNEGIQAYSENKKKDAMATGTLEAYMQRGQLENLSEGASKLADKFKNGKATLNDKLSLLGDMTASEGLKQQDQQRQMQQAKMAQMAQAQQMAAAQLTGANQENQMRAAKMAQDQQTQQQQGAARFGNDQLMQYMQGQGRGVLKPEVQARMAQMASDPMMSAAAKIQAATGSVPTSSEITNLMEKQQQTGTKIDEEQQKAKQEADNEYNTLLQGWGKVQNLQNKVQAYTQSALSSNGLNWISGRGMGLNIRAMMGDQSGQMMQGAVSPLVASVMSSLKNIRNQREFDMMMKQLPDPKDPNNVALDKVNTFVQNYQGLLKRATLYKQNLDKGMKPGDAEDAATAGVANQGSGQPQASPAAASGNFTPGHIYKDAQGNKARWNGTGFDAL